MFYLWTCFIDIYFLTTLQLLCQLCLCRHASHFYSPLFSLNLYAIALT